jgi:hypothetical protein
MKKTLLIAGALLALMAPMASAAGSIGLAWNNCVGAGGLSDDNFACNTNTGIPHQLIASFVPVQTVGAFNGQAGVVDVQVAAATLDKWWELGPTVGTFCRNGLAAADFAFLAGPFGCADPWVGQASGGADFSPVGSNRLRIRTVCAIAVPESLYAVDVDDNPIEYLVFRVTITNTKTTGTGACAGCTDPACIVFNSVKLTQPAGFGDFTITSGAQQHVTWKHGVIGGLGCPAATPTQRSTWGSVKALYR